MDNDELLIVIKDMFDKKTDELKDLFDKKTEEIKSYVDKRINNQDILIESMHSDIKAVAEGYDILDHKMDTLDKKVEALDKKVYALDKKVDTLDKKVYALDKRIETLDKKIDDKANELKSEIKVITDYVIGVDAKLNEHELVLKRVK